MNGSKDLVVLVPDGAILQIVHTLLDQRRDSLGIRPVVLEIIKDTLHDSSPEANAATLLRGFIRTHQRAMVLRDLEGSGWEAEGGKALEEALSIALTTNGWQKDSVAAIAIEPEVEAWLRFGSSHLQSLVKQRARRSQQMADLLFKEAVKNAVASTGGEAGGKPHRPKEAFEALLQQFGIPRSNALYKELAAKESLDACSVDSFNRFKAQLRAWFPKHEGETRKSP